MLPLKPLSNKQSEELLTAAGAVFDRNALDWIILQAGGNPEILLSVASIGQSARVLAGQFEGLLKRCPILRKQLFILGNAFVFEAQLEICK